MFTEEVGVSPLDGNGGPFYRSRVAEIVNRGHAFFQMIDGEVAFKAEIGSVAHGVAQVQGVWVPPHLRRQGLATSGMAALVNLVRSRIAPTVSLYVNHYNVAARLCYERVGFTRVGEFATVLI
jgi:predicted GNAT family acetyltransferase